MLISPPEGIGMTRHLTPLYEHRNGEKCYGVTGERAKLWNALQKDCFDEAYVKAGRRALKTLLVLRHFVNQVLQNSDLDFFIFAPTRQQVKDIYWRRLKQSIPAIWLEGEPNETELLIRTKWNSSIRLFSAETAKRIEGTPWKSGAVDEVADCPPHIFGEHILPAIVDSGGSLLRLGVPDYRGKGNEEFKKVFAQAVIGEERDRLLAQWKPGDERIPAIAFLWESSEVLSPKEYSTLARQLTKDLELQELRAQDIKPSEAAYAYFTEDNIDKDGSFCNYDGTALYVGCDFNFNWQRWGVCQVDHVQEPYRFKMIDEVAVNNATIDYQIAEAKRKFIAWNPMHEDGTGIIFYGDYSGDNKNATSDSTAWKKIRKAFPRARYRYRNNPPIHARLDSFNTLLCNAVGERRFFVHPRCEHIILDFSLVTRTMLTSVSAKAAAKHLTHISDAVGYLVHFYRHT